MSEPCEPTREKNATREPYDPAISQERCRERESALKRLAENDPTVTESDPEVHELRIY